MFRSAPVFRRDLHEEAVGIPEIDRRAAGIGLIRISRFGVRKLAVDFVSELFGSNPIHMVDCHCEMRDYAFFFSATESTLMYPSGKSIWIPVPASVAGQPFVTPNNF